MRPEGWSDGSCVCIPREVSSGEKFAPAEPRSAAPTGGTEFRRKAALAWVPAFAGTQFEQRLSFAKSALIVIFAVGCGARSDEKGIWWMPWH